MKVKRAFNQTVRLEITEEPPENHCKPSVDVLFRSVAEEYGGRVVAVILTGMGCDGVAGLRMLKSLGARVIAQDEATCTVFGMPQEAIRAAIVDAVLPLNRIAEALVAAVHPNGK
jgi:two-component system chemotaxis response regulator CheB